MEGLEVNNQASGSDKETVIRESLGSEVNCSNKSFDSTREKQFSPGACWSFDSTENEIGQSEKEGGSSFDEGNRFATGY